MENENDAQISALLGKVNQLKQVSVQIGDHVREDNKMLNGMDQFDTSGSMLGGTVKRPTALANSRDGWHTAYLAIFCGPRVSLHLPDDAIASNSTFSSRCFPPRAVIRTPTPHSPVARNGGLCGARAHVRLRMFAGV